MKNNKSVADLKIGESGIIKVLIGKEITHKLLEMGCLPGKSIEVLAKAPFGDPVCIAVDGGYHLALRGNEAATIILE